jgi:predicted RND superfamily exporter protein
VLSAIACVLCGGLIEASASVSPVADRPAYASEMSAVSGFALRYASIATESGVLIAVTLLAGLVLLSQRTQTPEARLRLALQVTTLGFTIALLLTLAGFISLFIIPGAQGAVR